MNLRRNILIFHQAALGDFVLTWPLAMALGRVFAQSRVIYVTGPDKGRLAEDVIGVEHHSAEDGWHALHTEGADPGERPRKLLAGAQCVVLFAQNDEPALLVNIARLAGDVPLIRIAPNPPPGVHVHAHHLAQLQSHGKLGGYVEQMQTLLRTTGLGRGAAPSPGILIHPGSGSPKKNWPLESFERLATRLRSEGHRVTLLLGEVERDQFDAKRLAALRTGPDAVVEPADLPALAKHLAGATAYLGNDSGPTHLAAALGLRTIALFGPDSSPDQWHPVGPRVSTLPFTATDDQIVAALYETSPAV
jgi:ADP-heptose:LPS heptosyltransferase